MSRVSFVDKLVRSGTVPIYFVRCKDASGKDCYFFMVSSEQKIAALKGITDGEFDLTQFGQIIASGFGHTPSDDVKKKLKDEFNYEA